MLSEQDYIYDLLTEREKAEVMNVMNLFTTIIQYTWMMILITIAQTV